MNELVLVDFGQYIISGGDHPAGMGGHQIVLRFPNGFGASIIKTPFSYGGSTGEFEMAVLLFPEEENDSYELTYDTPITDDVLGHLEPDACKDYLNQIMALAPGRPDPRDNKSFSNIDEAVDSLIQMARLTKED